MSIYVRNISGYLLPRCILSSNKRGLVDLAPGCVGILPDGPLFTSVQTWKDKKRLVEISEAEYNAVTAPVVAEKKASPVEIKNSDGVISIVQNYDEIPVAAPSAKPAIITQDTTGSKGIMISAPAATEALDTPAPGNPIQLSKEELAPKLFTDKGTIISPPEVVRGKVTVSTDEPVSSEKAPVVAEVLSADQIAGLSAWKKQEKALKAVTDNAVVKEVMEKTTFAVVKKICAERLGITIS